MCARQPAHWFLGQAIVLQAGPGQDERNTCSELKMSIESMPVLAWCGGSDDLCMIGIDMLSSNSAWHANGQQHQHKVAGRVFMTKGLLQMMPMTGLAGMKQSQCCSVESV